jgi:hypothetical protein
MIEGMQNSGPEPEDVYSCVRTEGGTRRDPNQIIDSTISLCDYGILAGDPSDTELHFTRVVNTSSENNAKWGLVAAKPATNIDRNREVYVLGSTFTGNGGEDLENGGILIGEGNTANIVDTSVTDNGNFNIAWATRNNANSDQRADVNLVRVVACNAMDLFGGAFQDIGRTSESNGNRPRVSTDALTCDSFAPNIISGLCDCSCPA